MLFKQVFNMILNKEHLTTEGIQKIIATKSLMNEGLSNELKSTYPNYTELIKPTLSNKDITIQDPQ